MEVVAGQPIKKFKFFRIPQSLYCPSAGQKARGLWVRDCGIWDNQQPEARFLASSLKADTADSREGSLWESTEKSKRKGNLHPSRLRIIAIHWDFLENKATQTNAVYDLGFFAI